MIAKEYLIILERILDKRIKKRKMTKKQIDRILKMEEAKPNDSNS